MKSARLKPPLLRPLLPPMRVVVPDFPSESDSPRVCSDDESEYYVSDEEDNDTNEEGEVYDLDLEYDKPIWLGNFQQVVDESEGIALPDAPLVKEEIKDDCVDDNSTKEKGEPSIGKVRIRCGDYHLDLKDDRPIWESYYLKVYESKGFDIKNYPGPRPLPTFFPIINERKTFRMLKGYAESALKKYNDDKGTNHVVEKIVKADGCGCREKIVDVKGGTCPEEVVNVKRGRCREKFLNVKGGGRRDKVVNVKGGRCREKFMNVKPGGYLVKYRNLKPFGVNVKRGVCRDYVYCLLFSAKTGDEKLIHFRAMVVKDQEDNLDFPVVRQVKFYGMIREGC